MISNKLISNSPAELVLSIINMKLRNDFSSLNSLISYYELDETSLLEKLAGEGYSYSHIHNQFKA